nr:hypothetical protein GCM10020185_65680 [Pseudomonas brassicacearum subsp. brassicacearum]
MVWQQVYDPFGNAVLSTLLAAVPVVVMLASLAFFHVKAHLAALMALASALLIAIFAFGMPAGMAGSAALYGAANGLLPIGWIVLNIIFLHRLTTENGSFKVLQDSLARITDDRRLQLLLIAFLLRCVLRRRGGFRHAGGGDRGDPDRAGLLPLGRLGPGADRQHRARGVRRPGYADHHPGQGYRAG